MDNFTEEKTLFTAVDKPLLDFDTENEKNQEGSINIQSGENSIDLTNEISANDFISKFPKKKFSDASDKTRNDGPKIDLGDKNFGIFTPQVVDKLQAENCIHDICYPPNFDIEKERINLSTPLPPKKPAKTYKFELDTFQKRAINCVERNHNVLVAAHTSSGKTTIAEYAIAKSIKENTRVIYTSPIKALSNQKYRDLYEEFQDVGLMTGDVTINPSSSCLVMTTEILRNMLYRGSEVIREVSWVIFDEIHYMRDKSRGVIYEECIILLPKITKFIFLSATIPNATQFACWIAKINRTPCNVVYTEKRPVPLLHYVSPSMGSGLTLVLDKDKDFKEINYLNALSNIKNHNIIDMRNNRKRKSRGSEDDLFQIMKLIMSKKHYPTIIFSFSRRECETNALLMSKLNFNDETEQKMIEQIFNNAIDSLSTEDQKMPQIKSILPLLKRGIGIHHSGLLPILKEIIEILFQEGLIKALFATETFAMGINMPAKSIVYTNLRKFDGVDTRYLTSGEYTQMSGRAGRRGIDKQGMIILMINQKIEIGVIKKMLQGLADSLNSSFNLSYNMLLNLLRVEGSDPEYMISHSFNQFQSVEKTPAMIKEIKQLESENSKIIINDIEKIREIYDVKSRCHSVKQKMKEIRNLPEHLLPFINPGRIVKIIDGEVDWGWGAIINFEKLNTKNLPNNGLFSKNQKQRFIYIVDVLLKHSTSNLGEKIPYQGGEVFYKVIPCELNTIDEISSIRIYLPSEVVSAEQKETAYNAIQKAFETFNDKLPLLNPVENMRINSKSFEKLCRKYEHLEHEYNKFEIESNPELEQQLNIYKNKFKIEARLEQLKIELKKLENNLEIKQTLKYMTRALKKLGHITEDNVVNIKGRVACDISTVDELLATELLLTGCFSDLSSEQIVSLCSCLVNNGKSDDYIKLKSELSEPYRRLQQAAKRVAEIKKDSKIEIEVENYVSSFQPSLMEVTFAWCKGISFTEICKLTNIFEGSIIRVIRRLGELLKEYVYACKIIGNEELRLKFEKGIKLIKRDIIFAASLYL